MLPAPPTRWRRRKDARPAEILEAALAVFAERGYAATRMDDIAARAGVTKGTIYLYFESKDAVFRGLVQQSIGVTLETQAAALAHFEGSAGDLLRLVLRGIGHFMCHSDRIVLPKIIVAEAGNFPSLAEFYRREVIDRGLALLRAVIARGVAAANSGPWRKSMPRGFASRRFFLAPSGARPSRASTPSPTISTG